MAGFAAFSQPVLPQEGRQESRGDSVLRTGHIEHSGKRGNRHLERVPPATRTTVGDPPSLTITVLLRLLYCRPRHDTPEEHTTTELNWESGEGLLTVEEPSIVDAAFERGEPHVGVAVIGLSLNCDDLHVIAPRIARSITAGIAETRMQGFTALGHSVRLFRSLDSRLDPILRDFKNYDVAEIAIDDIIHFVPWRKLPYWLKMKALKQQLHWYLIERWR